MNLEHIALTFTNHKEIKQFYQEILGFAEIRSFILQKDLAREIFGIGKESRIFHLQKDDLSMELFLMPERFEHVFNHICNSVLTGKHGQKGNPGWICVYSCQKAAF